MTYPRTIVSLCLLPSALRHYEPNQLKIGYVIPTVKKKQNASAKQCFRSNEECWYNCLEPSANLELQGEVQAIVHKAVDYISMNVI